MEGKRSFRKAVEFSSTAFAESSQLGENPFILHLLKEEEITEIKERIVAPTRKNAGEGLKRAVEALITHRMRYDETLEKIKNLIDPNKTHTRVSRDEIERQASLAAVKQISTSLATMPEKLLRQFAETVLGDTHLDYTVEELPTVIACKQLGISLSEEKPHED